VPAVALNPARRKRRPYEDETGHDQKTEMRPFSPNILFNIDNPAKPHSSLR
jgi:hypothetical protein